MSDQQSQKQGTNLAFKRKTKRVPAMHPYLQAIRSVASSQHLNRSRHIIGLGAVVGGWSVNPIASLPVQIQPPTLVFFPVFELRITVDTQCIN